MPRPPFARRTIVGGTSDRRAVNGPATAAVADTTSTVNAAATTHADRARTGESNIHVLLFKTVACLLATRLCGTGRRVKYGEMDDLRLCRRSRARGLVRVLFPRARRVG